MLRSRRIDRTVLHTWLVEQTKLNSGPSVPDSIRELVELLNSYNSQEAQAWQEALIKYRASGGRQVARYDAVAYVCGGELKRLPEEDTASAILVGFLRADFPFVLRSVRAFWREELAGPSAAAETEANFSAVAIQHVVRCLGTICAYLRFGGSNMVERAIAKLDRLADGFLHSRDRYSALLAQLGLKVRALPRAQRAAVGF
jgi:hypothetical protein